MMAVSFRVYLLFLCFPLVSGNNDRVLSPLVSSCVTYLIFDENSTTWPGQYYLRKCNPSRRHPSSSWCGTLSEIGTSKCYGHRPFLRHLSLCTRASSTALLLCTLSYPSCIPPWIVLDFSLIASSRFFQRMRVSARSSYSSQLNCEGERAASCCVIDIRSGSFIHFLHVWPAAPTTVTRLQSSCHSTNALIVNSPCSYSSVWTSCFTGHIAKGSW